MDISVDWEAHLAPEPQNVRKIKIKSRGPLHKGRVHKGRARHKLRIESRIFLNESAQYGSIVLPHNITLKSPPAVDSKTPRTFCGTSTQRTRSSDHHYSCHQRSVRHACLPNLPADLSASTAPSCPWQTNALQLDWRPLEHLPCSSLTMTRRTDTWRMPMHGILLVQFDFRNKGFTRPLFFSRPLCVSEHWKNNVIFISFSENITWREKM